MVQSNEILTRPDSKYRTFFENSAVAMLIIVDGVFVDCNAATVAMLGYSSKEELINLPPSELSPELQPDGRSSNEKAAEMMNLALENGNHQFEWDHLKKNGTIIPVEVSLTAIETDGETTLHTVWRDLTRRKQAEKALRESEKRFRAIFETIPDPVILARLDEGTVIDVNQAFVAVTGITSLEARGHNSEQLGLWVDSSQRALFREQLKDKGVIDNLEADFRVRGNQVRTGLLSARVLDLGGNACLLIAIRDISTEKSAERALLEMDRIKSEFISSAAHELNTPLSAMMGFAELLIDPDMSQKLSDEQKQEILHDIYDRGDALSQIIHDLLDVSRIESGQPIRLDLQDFDLGEILGKTVSFFRRAHPHHHFRLDLPKDETLVMRADRHRITQVFENLVSNAVKYSPKGSEVTVSGTQDENHWQISFADSGVGMTPEQVERIYDTFYRVENANTSATGLGLGMSIVKQIVEAHHGTIEIESSLGVGTRVCVSLPGSPD